MITIFKVKLIKTSIIKESFEKQAIVRLHYQNVVKENFDGVVVHIGQKIIILACVGNFEFDGYQVLLKERIRGYRNSSIEKASTQIVNANRENNKFKPPKWVYSLNSVEDTVKVFKKRKIWPAIEVIYNKTNCFYIGPIRQINGDCFSLFCYDASGKWEKDYAIGMDEVIRMEWGSKYCKHFNNFMKIER